MYPQQPQPQNNNSFFDDLKKFTDNLSTGVQREENILLPECKVDVRLIYSGTPQDHPEVSTDPSVMFPVPDADIEYARTLARSHGRGSVVIKSNRLPADISTESAKKVNKIAGIGLLMLVALIILPEGVISLAVAGMIAYLVLSHVNRNKEIAATQVQARPALPVASVLPPTSVPMDTLRRRSLDILAMGDEVFQRAGVARADFLDDVRILIDIHDRESKKGYFNGVQMDDDYRSDVAKFVGADARVHRVFEVAESMGADAESPLNLPDQQW